VVVVALRMPQHPVRRCFVFGPPPSARSQPEIIKYTEEEYKALLNDDPTWTREHTDRLFDAARRFDLRWPLIADRLDMGTAHTLPDMKNRFYTVTSRLIAARCVVCAACGWWKARVCVSCV
jgi:hypothetical protein